MNIQLCLSLTIANVIFLIHKIFGMEQADCQIFLQWRCIYLRSVENCNSESAAMASHMEAPTQQEKENIFIRGKGSLEGNHKQGTQGFSYTESFPGKKGLSSSCWACLLPQGVRAPPPGLWTIFNWGFCLLIFLQEKAFYFWKSSAHRDCLRSLRIRSPVN